MLGDFITRIMILLVGYAYPAYGCYKSVEKKKPEIQELSYWCKYWILVSLLTVFERIGDIIVPWLPLYGEIKIAILIYLLSPKSKVLQCKKIIKSNAFQNRNRQCGGPSGRTPHCSISGITYVYETLLRPYMSRHQSNIDHRISVLKIRGHSVIIQLLQCGYHWILQIFKHLQQQFVIVKKNNRAKSKDRQQTRTSFMFLR